jgi:hypothetical protein
MRYQGILTCQAPPLPSTDCRVAIHYGFLGDFARVAGFPARSRSRRSAVRFFAAASDAFFARAERSSSVMFFAAVLPPSFPNFLDNSRIAANTSAGILALMYSSYT